MTNVDRFVEKFREIWAAPQPERFRELVAADGTLLHPGMHEPLAGTDVPDYVAAIQRAMPDVRLRVDRWAASGEDVLIEWTMEGTFAGAQVSWSGADRFTLRDEEAIEGVAYFDTLPLWSRVDPSMARGSMLDHAATSAARP